MDAVARAERNLVVRSTEPLNAEPPADRLATFLTPQQDFYIRCHGPIPALHEDHAVEVAGLVDEPRFLRLADLRSSFPEHRVTAVLQCAGNRRSELQVVQKTTGDPWGVGAIGNAEWTGVRLADVLRAARIDAANARFVAFRGADEVEVEGTHAPFEVSIAFEKAMQADTLLAHAMNGEPLAPEHGAPLRLIVPGYAGVRSAKWLTRIEVRDRPSDAPMQQKDYKLFPPCVAREEADWSKGMVIEEMPLNAAVTTPDLGRVQKAGALRLTGYAIAYGRAVARVDVSIDGGRSWHPAEIDRPGSSPWSWAQWIADIELTPGRHEVCVRAVDAAGQTQPARPDEVWNFAGYLSSAWHRAPVTVE